MSCEGPADGKRRMTGLQESARATEEDDPDDIGRSMASTTIREVLQDAGEAEVTCHDACGATSAAISPISHAGAAQSALPIRKRNRWNAGTAEGEASAVDASVPAAPTPAAAAPALEEAAKPMRRSRWSTPAPSSQQAAAGAPAVPDHTPAYIDPTLARLAELDRQIDAQNMAGGSALQAFLLQSERAEIIRSLEMQRQAEAELARNPPEVTNPAPRGHAPRSHAPRGYAPRGRPSDALTSPLEAALPTRRLDPRCCARPSPIRALCPRRAGRSQVRAAIRPDAQRCQGAHRDAHRPSRADAEAAGGGDRLPHLGAWQGLVEAHRALRPRVRRRPRAYVRPDPGAVAAGSRGGAEASRGRHRLLRGQPRGAHGHGHVHACPTTRSTWAWACACLSNHEVHMGMGMCMPVQP